MLIGGVIDHQLDQHLDLPVVRGADEHLKIIERAVAWIHVAVVGDVVAVVLQRRREEREQPQAGDAKTLEVIELQRQAPQLAHAVVVAVEERFDVRLIDDGILVPKRVIVSGALSGSWDAEWSGGGQVHGVGRHRMCPWRVSGSKRT